MRLKITPTDIKRGKLLKPDWYLLEITRNFDEPNKNKDATNTVIQFVGCPGSAAEGIPFTVWISEKAPGILGIPLLKALGVTINEDEGIDFDVPEDSLTGRKVRAKIITGSYNNRPNNTIETFAPPVAAPTS